MRLLIVFSDSPYENLVFNLAKEIAMLFNNHYRGTNEAIEATILQVFKTKKQKEKQEIWLEEKIKGLRTHIHQITQKTCIGDIVKEIVQESCALANEPSYNLIIMGWLPRPKLYPVVVPSASERVMKCITAPIIIAKGKTEAINRLLVCDSGLEEQPLPHIIASDLPFLLQKGQTITILHVMSQIGLHPSTPSWQLYADAEELMQAETPEGSVLKRDAQLFAPFGLQPHLRVRHGFVVDEILAEAKEGDYNLIIIGAHETIGGIPFLLKDQTHSIIDKSDRPVMVIHRPKLFSTHNI